LKAFVITQIFNRYGRRTISKKAIHFLINLSSINLFSFLSKKDLAAKSVLGYPLGMETTEITNFSRTQAERMLDVGEPLLCGDQWLHPIHDKWYEIGIGVTGRPVDADYKYRRPFPEQPISNLP
jgi:hypothetical protein